MQTYQKDTRHTIFLPCGQHFTTLLTLDCHLRITHGGIKDTLTELRTRFWIVKGYSVFCQWVIWHTIQWTTIKGSKSTSTIAVLCKERPTIFMHWSGPHRALVHQENWEQDLDCFVYTLCHHKASNTFMMLQALHLSKRNPHIDRVRY